jgi:hypothetical protein
MVAFFEIMPRAEELKGSLAEEQHLCNEFGKSSIRRVAALSALTLTEPGGGPERMRSNHLGGAQSAPS